MIDQGRESPQPSNGEQAPAKGPAPVARPDSQGRSRGEAPGAPKGPTADAAEESSDSRLGKPDERESSSVGSVRPDAVLSQHTPEGEFSPENQDLAKMFEEFPPEVQEELSNLAARQKPEELAKIFAEQHVLSKDQARAVLLKLYPDTFRDNPEKLEEVINAGFVQKEGDGVEPAPLEREIQAEMQQAIETDLTPKAEAVLHAPSKESREEAMEKFEEASSRFRDRFPEAMKKGFLKGLKISTVSGGIIAFLLVLLMAVHAPSGK